MKGWKPELTAKAALRRRLPGWATVVIKKSLRARDLIFKGQSEGILQLVREGANIDYKDDSLRGRTLLHISLGTLGQPINEAVVQTLLV